MSTKPKILCVGDNNEGQAQPLSGLKESFELVAVRNPLRALAQLSSSEFAGVYVTAEHFGEALRLGRLLQNERILEGMPDGVVLLDAENTILWANDRFEKWAGKPEVRGHNFYQSLNSPEILGPDYCPFHTALASRKASSSTLRSGENHYFQVHAAPVFEGGQPPQNLIVTVRDVTAEMLQQQKLAAIHKAGVELSNLTAEEVFQMEVEDRIDLLKSNILHYTQDLLNFDVVEIRLLDQASGALTPLLAVGLDPEATDRQLFARPQHNGVTGFVAATGKSYLCEDTTEDPLYLEGFKGAKSSLTVPLILHDQVIGTFNVESPEPRAFTESDLQFLEIFSRDVALALNTLELFVAQKANACFESVEAIHGAVALPVDEILNDAVNVMERYIGHEPQVVERLQRILRNARDMKQAITKVGEKLTTAKAVPAGVQLEENAQLRGVRVLVVDADDSVRSAAHALLERFGCIVETSHDGEEAVIMVRSCLHDAPYNVIICDIRLPDMSGYGLLCKLQEIIDPVPMVLMTGYGYDPGHSIVKCRQAGLHPKAILFKPFRRDQLLETIDTMLDPTKAIPGRSCDASTSTPATT
ncbi:MAG TPA: response regulator [Pirellulaceae bacterium]|nr:response regulator [Pirellulaceae bacterium]